MGKHSQQRVDERTTNYGKYDKGMKMVGRQGKKSASSDRKDEGTYTNHDMRVGE
jgi:hypothetical protein